jgi:hypothetical protein
MEWCNSKSLRAGVWAEGEYAELMYIEQVYVEFVWAEMGLRAECVNVPTLNGFTLKECMIINVRALSRSTLNGCMLNEYPISVYHSNMVGLGHQALTHSCRGQVCTSEAAKEWLVGRGWWHLTSNPDGFRPPIPIRSHN